MLRYIELKSGHGDSGPAWIARVTLSRSGRTVYFNGQALKQAGGSLVSEAATYELLLSSCHTIWIKAAPEEHMSRVVAQGDMRPMAGNAEAMEDLRQILLEREALYARADAVFDTAGKSPDAAFSQLLQMVQHKIPTSAK